MAQLVMLFATLTIANFLFASAAECPQDPLACLVVQMLNAKNEQNRKVIIDEEQNNRDMIVDSTLEQPEQLNNEAAKNVQVPPAKSNVTYCVNETSSGCTKCTVCPKKALLLRSCNSTHDSVCVCQDGTYFSALTYECRPCDSCTAGYGVWRQCTRNRNTVCRACPPGTYSGVISGKLGCLLCSSCRTDQVMLQECSRKQDTVCIDNNISRKKYFATESSEHVASNYYGPSSALPIYFTVLVVLICGLVGYVLMQCRIKNMVKPPLPLTRNHIVYMPTSIPLRHTKKPTSGSNQYVPLPTNVQSTPRTAPTVQQQQTPKNIVLNISKGQVTSKVHPGRLVRSSSKNRSGRSSSGKSRSTNRSSSVRRSESVKAPTRNDAAAASRPAEV